MHLLIVNIFFLNKSKSTKKWNANDVSNEFKAAKCHRTEIIFNFNVFLCVWLELITQCDKNNF